MRINQHIIHNHQKNHHRSVRDTKESYQIIKKCLFVKINIRNLWKIKKITLFLKLKKPIKMFLWAHRKLKVKTRSSSS